MSGQSPSRLSSSGPEAFYACPDGGRCWHGCSLLSDQPEKHPEGRGMPCWRVKNAEPFSGHNGTGRWSHEEMLQHDPTVGPFETDVEKVRGAAVRLRKGQWRIDMLLADLLETLADHHDSDPSSADEIIPGWTEAVILAKTYLGEI